MLQGGLCSVYSGSARVVCVAYCIRGEAITYQEYVSFQTLTGEATLPCHDLSDGSVITFASEAPSASPTLAPTVAPTVAPTTQGKATFYSSVEDSLITSCNDMLTAVGRNSFQFTDEYTAAGYETGDIQDLPDNDFFTSDQMTIVNNEIVYTASTNQVYHFDNDSFYCAGDECDENVSVDLTQTSFYAGSGLDGVAGLCFNIPWIYDVIATVTYRDDTTESYILNDPSIHGGGGENVVVGFDAPNARIKSVDFEIQNNGYGYIYFDSMSYY